MKPIDKISNDLFEKLRSDRFSPLEMQDENAIKTTDPQKAKIFLFHYKENGVSKGLVIVDIVDNRSLKISYSQDLTDSITNKDIWFRWLANMKNFAKRNLLNYQPQDFTKGIAAKQIKTKAKIEGTQVTESTLYGSKRKSYEDSGKGVKLIVNHRSNIDETKPGARSRRIESIYIQREDGERYRFPYESVTAARAMARHVAEGGTPYDQLGKNILEMIREVRSLSRFARKTRLIATEDSSALDIRNKVLEYSKNRKKILGAISTERGYSRFKEELAKDTAISQDEKSIKTLKEKFTKKVWKQELDEVLPLVDKVLKEYELTKVLESDPQIKNMVSNRLLTLKKDDSADELFKNTRFENGSALITWILSDIASRASGHDSRILSDFAARLSDQWDDEGTSEEDKSIAIRLANRYIDDVKMMERDPSYKDEVRVESNIAEVAIPATTMTPQQKAQEKIQIAQQDRANQQAAVNASRVMKAAGIQAANPNVVKDLLKSGQQGKMPSNQARQAVGALGQIVANSALSDPKNAAALTAMMKKITKPTN